LAGPKVVEDTIEFFRSLSGIEAGLRQRAAEVSTILRSDEAAFVLASSPRAEAIDEAAHLAAALRDGGFPLRSMVINLVHPTPSPLTAELPEVPAGPLADHLAMYRDLCDLSAAEGVEMETLRALAGDVTLAEVPMLDDVQDLDGLLRLGRELIAAT
jgi:anion-transporting  ArsA/GET3 family ATPase